MPDRRANPVRGEALLTIGADTYVLRPDFESLVATEEEIGSLFAFVEQAAEGQLRLGEIITLFWHCLAEKPDGLQRDKFARELTGQGLSQLTPPLKILLKQILAGGAADAETV